MIVIGAGINGAGVARDAAMRGLNVLLLDKGDIGAGTSSASTRLIHGGLRYLEHAEFGLVRESLREREILLRIAPHLVKPLPILVPIFRWSRRGRTKIQSGMVAYDLLSWDKSLPRHRLLSPTDTLKQAPGLTTDGLVGAGLYSDAQVEYAERLVLENVLDAAKHGVVVRTYSRVSGFANEAGQTVGVEFVDLMTNETHTANSAVFINASGPWVDELLAGKHQDRRLIGGTKGSHIVVAPFAGAPTVAMYVEARADQRPFFIIPWHGNYLIGTTNIRYTGSPDDVRIEEAEVAYLLQETNAFFPAAQLKQSSILFTFSGVRPLAFSSARDEQSITRRHFLRESQGTPGLISIVGGKLTTYRQVAEETVDLIGKRLNRSLPRCTTHEDALPGALNSSSLADFLKGASLSERTTEHLLKLYGARARKVAELALSDSRLAQVIDEESGGAGAQIVFAFKEEFAQTLSDVLLRRTLWAFNSNRGANVVKVSAAFCADYFGWSTQRVAQELSRFEEEMWTKHSIGKD